MSRVSDRRTLILGGGLTGISAALHLHVPWLLFEKENRLGGLARTESREGFYFDHTGHWLHLRDAAIQALTARLMGDSMVEVSRIARIYSHGVFTRYPFQGNLYGLPAEVVHECLLGYVEALLKSSTSSTSDPKNFEDYIFTHFGAGIAKHFMIPYNWKLWGVHPREISSAWCSRFVPRPNTEQVIAGAVGAGPPELGYNIRFRYPKQGGIETFTRALIGELDPSRIHLNATVTEIDPHRREICVNGVHYPYHALITTIPLPRLIELCTSVPDAVNAAASTLRATALRYLNVATKRKAPCDYHWVYVPEERLPFYRVGVFSNAMPSMAPSGCSSLYVEMSGLVSRCDEQTKAEAIRSLVEVNAIHSPDDVLFAEWRTIDPAYVVFDDNYHRALDVITPFLTQHHIHSRGRYGSWIYNAMEDSLLAGREAAELANTRLSSGEPALR